MTRTEAVDELCYILPAGDFSLVIPTDAGWLVLIYGTSSAAVAESVELEDAVREALARYTAAPTTLDTALREYSTLAARAAAFVNN